MLIIRRRLGQRIDLTDRAGGVVRVWVHQIDRNTVHLAFDDPTRVLQIERPERLERLADVAAGAAPTASGLSVGAGCEPGPALPCPGHAGGQLGER